MDNRLLIQGDARAIPLPDAYVQCVVTSPPYWGLRDYGIPPGIWGGDGTCLDVESHAWANSNRRNARATAPSASSTLLGNGHVGGGPKLSTTPPITAATDQTCMHCGAWRGVLGSEPTPEMFVAHMVEVFREVRRVLRDDGTVWLNLGDSYVATSTGNRGTKSGLNGADSPVYAATLDKYTEAKTRRAATPAGMKQKDLIGIPWMVAFALRADGWYLRRDIIWAKGVSFCPTYAGSAMPESVTDRPAGTHEYLFLLTKSARYYYDVHAVKEVSTGNAHPRGKGGNPKSRGARERDGNGNRQNSSWSETVTELMATRNLRSVWTINPKPYPGAHFATFPPTLVTPCIKAGTPEGGCCPTCGKGYKRIVEKGQPNIAQQRASGADTTGGYTGKQAGHGRRHAGFNARYFAKVDYAEAGAQDPGSAKASILAGMIETRTVAWQPQCMCGAPGAGLPRMRKHWPWQRRLWRWAVWQSAITKRWGFEAAPVVFDPFSGSGTTATVAAALGRFGIGLDRKMEYIDLAKVREI